MKRSQGQYVDPWVDVRNGVGPRPGEGVIPSLEVVVCAEVFSFTPDSVPHGRECPTFRIWTFTRSFFFPHRQGTSSSPEPNRVFYP